MTDATLADTQSRKIVQHSHDHTNGDASQCSICRNKRRFEMPASLYEALLKNDIVLFAGGGVSTEDRNVFPYSLYENVCEDLEIPVTQAPSYPDVLSRFSETRGGRGALLRKIKDRFDYIRSFPEIYNLATRFHQELATVFLFENIVTTNWDDYFERECGATPFVTADDFAFWNLPGRKVLKIHGSVNSFGSIVATREDYENCYTRLATGLLGSSLKMALATKTILYIGFSFRDDDFLRLHDLLTGEMRGISPPAYIVTLDDASDVRFRELGLQPIYTDCTYFVAELKRKLIREEHMITDERFHGLDRLFEAVSRAHARVSDIDLQRHPDAIYCLSYQDGLMHALGRILARRNTGYYSHSCNAMNAARTYKKTLRPEKLKARDYPDVAYIDGYVNGHLYFLVPDTTRGAVPIYYMFGPNQCIGSFNEYKKALPKGAKLHKGAHALAVKIVEKASLKNGMTFHHPAFL
jgi:hypothetical protein